MDLGVFHSVVGEVWVPINGSPNYVVSNRGRVYSLTREETWGNCTRIRQGRILTPRLGDRGYYYVALCNNGRNQTKNVHRLVAEAFLPNPEHLECVNHRDEFRTNNDASNLEWCTVAYNVTYGNAKNKTKQRFIETGWSRPVEQYDREGNFIAAFASVSEAGRSINRNPGGISACCNGTRNIAYGYVWKYGKSRLYS